MTAPSFAFVIPWGMRKGFRGISLKVYHPWEPSAYGPSRFTVPLGEDPHSLPDYTRGLTEAGIVSMSPPKVVASNYRPFVDGSGLGRRELHDRLIECDDSNVSRDNVFNYVDLIVTVRPFTYRPTRAGYRDHLLGQHPDHPEWYERTGLGLLGVAVAYAEGYDWTPIPPNRED